MKQQLFLVWAILRHQSNVNRGIYADVLLQALNINILFAAMVENKLPCGIFTNTTAAISVLSVGATTGVKNRKLVEQLLEEYEG